MRRSPNLLTSAPPAGANARRTKAKTDTMADAAMYPTSNDGELRQDGRDHAEAESDQHR